MSDRIIVMYLGRIGEIGRTDEIFESPQHPYTQALLAANPSLEDTDETIRLAGSVPDPADPPRGCRFHTRCPVVTELCGWDVDDAVRILETRGHLLDDLKAVNKETPFDGELAFDTTEQAKAAAAELRSDRMPEAMREACELVEVSGNAVRLRYTPVDEMAVSGVGMDHQTACILYNGAQGLDLAR